MAAIYVVHLSGFHLGDDAVLLAMDVAGLNAITTALRQTHQHGLWRLVDRRKTHQFQVQAGSADVELRDDHVHWRLDPAKLAEIIGKLTAMTSSSGPCHHYVDISTPADTLVLSVDEYTGSTWLT
ncbi:hypothetical protein [Mycolicibacterium llatzerense]|uniref:hypothetical protein n=1 Tax=Mycolicibacterium llatzerense TaxID=280871 RepID=UPI0031CE295C